ncbi:hypothetical protein EV702DRAFT_1182518 [Suillus placidus]|uniref:Uncharacterized protein n=1 Tax=Suillus placidus TaxID=48579 RepID=A0A9P7CWY8_9AGAM|nr:hypothetical protein EV702DRAFT_1182518 [Suillus placidus]
MSHSARRDHNTHQIPCSYLRFILGSNKTTVSVATGANDYYPLYASIGNIHNNEHVACLKYRKYHQQMFHLSISKILENLRPGMTKPEVVHFSDGHYRHVIYGLGLYIADYKEQVLLACIVRSWCPRCMSHHKDLDSKLLCRNHDHMEALIEEVMSSDLWDEFGIITDLVPFSNDFPRGDIHELIALDILHQLIKGRGFTQWTGDDSKVLMKVSLTLALTVQVYLSTIEGYIPTDVVRTFHAFLEFCYLVRRNIIMESTLVRIQDTVEYTTWLRIIPYNTLNRFRCYRKIFKSTGVIFTFSLPCQHSCSHYALLIQLFGAPNGLCSSITKTKHIKAVKEPWRCSSRYHALGQMLVTNQRLDKLAASRIDFKSRGMLNSTCLSKTLQALRDAELSIPHLNNLLRRFLFEQLHLDDKHSPSDVPLTHCPRFNGKIQVFNSVALMFYAPSDCSGIGRIMGFFSFTFKAVSYPCAVVHWFKKADDGPDKDTGMWIVKPLYDTDQSLLVGIIHIDSIYRAAHLIPIYGTHAIPKDLKHYDSYDAFCAFYVNKFADHHAFEIAS